MTKYLSLFQFAFNVCHEIALTSSKLKKLIKWPPKSPKSLAELQKLEALHEGLDLYLWLRCEDSEYTSKFSLLPLISLK